MTVRRARKIDIDEIMRVTASAKELMRSRGNKVQWAEDYPSRGLWLSDISSKNAYVVEEEGRIVAAFAFIFG